jgi:hypothetical protein
MYLCKPTTAVYSSRHYGISFSEPSHQLHEWVESFLITSVQHGRAVAFSSRIALFAWCSGAHAVGVCCRCMFFRSGDIVYIDCFCCLCRFCCRILSR